MTLVEFMAAAGVSTAVAERWFTKINAALQDVGIIHPVDIAMYIAQVGHESAGFTRVTESLNYSPEGLLATFGKRITAEQAGRLGRTDAHPADQPAIANLVYAHRLGNSYENDGWTYRGRGLLQITGRYNYERCGRALGINLLASPELLCQETFAAQASAWFYVDRGCLKYSGELRRITTIINGGENGLGDRFSRYKTALEALNATRSV